MILGPFLARLRYWKDFAHDMVASSSQQHLPNAQDLTISRRQDTMEVVKTIIICGDRLGRGLP